MVSRFFYYYYCYYYLLLFLLSRVSRALLTREIWTKFIYPTCIQRPRRGRWIHVGYINFAIFCQMLFLVVVVDGVTVVSSSVKKLPLAPREIYVSGLRSFAVPADTNTGVPYISPPWNTIPREIYACGNGRHHRYLICFVVPHEKLSCVKKKLPLRIFTVVTLCALLTLDVLAIANFLAVFVGITSVIVI